LSALPEEIEPGPEEDSREMMTSLFVGYFPKRIMRRDSWLKAPAVREIWSVSECISKGPPDWINKWRHNDLWLYDTRALAESVVPPDDRRA
jgi:hypothetical protein